MLTGPIVWLVLLQYNYSLSYVACETGRTWFMHLGIAVAVAAVAGAALLARRAGRSNRGDADEATHPLADDTRVQRADWMSLTGLGISVFFIIVIVAMEVPLLILEECR